MALSSKLSSAALVAFLTCGSLATAGNPVFRCDVDGTVTFQSSPCPAAKPTRRPTVEELNAERKRRIALAAAQAAPSPKATGPGPLQNTVLGSSNQSNVPSRDASFRCDGRTYCSQMRSCTEAKYFLANCPGVKMDGNRDGTPCEEQWCTHAFAK